MTLNRCSGNGPWRAFRRGGIANPNAKLTPSKVAAIRASNKTQAELAREYGVTQHTISCVINYKTWREV